MKDVPADTPFIFFIGFICVLPLQDFVGGMATLICSAGHDRLSRACSAPSSMPNNLKYKAIVAESCRCVQVETLFLLRALMPFYYGFDYILCCEVFNLITALIHSH